MKLRGFILLLSAAFITACEISEPLEPAPVEEDAEGRTEWGTFVFSSGEESGEEGDVRTVYSNGTILWSTGDQIRMGYTVGGVWQGASGDASASRPAKLYGSDELSEGGVAAYFTVPGQFPATGSGEYAFYTVYPASAVSENFPSAPSTTITIPTEQTPAAASFDPAADLMVGHSVKAYSTKPSEPIPLMWERKVAHGEITLKNLSSINGFSPAETIQSITLTAQEGAMLTGTYTLDLSDGDLTEESSSNSVTIHGDNLSWNGGNLTFWIGILPGTITRLQILLETDKAVYAKQYKGISRTFAGNSHNTLGIGMSSAIRHEKAYYLVTEALSDWSGDYVLARYAQSTNITYALGAKDGNGTFSTTVEVTPDNGAISLTQGAPINVRIEKSTNGYTLKSGNEYLGYESPSDNTATSYNRLYYSSSFAESKYEWTLTYNSEEGAEKGTVAIKTVYNTTPRYLQLNKNNKSRYACYANGSQWSPNLYRLGVEGGSIVFDEGVSVVTENATDVTSVSAALNGSYSGATGEFSVTEEGFYFGTSPTSMTKAAISGTSTPFTVSKTGLASGTTYFFRAYVIEYDSQTNISTERIGEIQQFTTSISGSMPKYLGCYEIPALGTISGFAEGYEVLPAEGSGGHRTKWLRWNTSSSTRKIVTHTFYNSAVSPSRAMRSFTLLQDYDKKCALWVACSMNNDMFPSLVDRSEKWEYDPALDTDWQPNLTESYPDKNGLSYDRGHQIAASFRETTTDQVKMTCYFSNMTPQLASLNRGTWSKSIEAKVLALGEATTGRDTLYVVSGPLFIGNYETVEDIDGVPCAKPTHYFQCFMKVSFDSGGNPQSAKGAAYLIEHVAKPTVNYSNIDYIESLAGFDFFANVPSAIQNAAEATATPYEQF